MGARPRGVRVLGLAVCLWAVSGSSVSNGLPERPRMDRPWREIPRYVPTTTTTAAPPPPVVEDDPVPRVPRARKGAPKAMGRIIVPRLGLDTAFYEGGTTATIDFGPSHMPNTAQPGHAGNTVFAGHRVTYTHPFRHLDQLQRGDTVTFVVPWGTFTYAFTHHDVVNESDVDILLPRGGHTATLFACHPPGSARYRIVAHFDLASAPATDHAGAVSAAPTYSAPPAAAPPPPTTSTSLVLPGRR